MRVKKTDNYCTDKQDAAVVGVLNRFKVFQTECSTIELSCTIKHMTGSQTQIFQSVCYCILILLFFIESVKLRRSGALEVQYSKPCYPGSLQGYMGR